MKDMIALIISALSIVVLFLFCLYNPIVREGIVIVGGSMIIGYSIIWAFSKLRILKNE